MTLQRRQILRLAAGAAALPLASRVATAQTYPSRAITMVVPYGGGGPADRLARPLAARMSAALGQPIEIENVPGESGVTGVAQAVKAKPDGYTLSYGHNGSHVVNGAVFSLPFDLLTDFEPIALLPNNPLLISARKGFPAATLQELIDQVKANPGKVTTATAGAGSGTHVNAVYFQNRTGARLEFVKHKSVQTAMQALIAEQLDILFDQASNSLPNLRAGRIKAYAVTAATRMASAPDVPTVDEAGLAGFHSGNWYGLWAPKGTPKDVIARLDRAVQDSLNDPEVGKQLHAQGLELPPRELRRPDAFAAYHKAEIEKWWPIIKAANVKGP